MELNKLDNSFYTDNTALTHALDFDQTTNTWSGNKVRGHGVVTIKLHGLTFAIPVRSRIKHHASFILEVNRGDKYVKGMGLDYSKALLIRDAKHVSAQNFVLNSKDAGKKLIGKEQHITNQFEQYVDKYVRSFKKGDQNVLGSSEYRYSTLQHYHSELGLELPPSQDIASHDAPVELNEQTQAVAGGDQ